MYKFFYATLVKTAVYLKQYVSVQLATLQVLKRRMCLVPTLLDHAGLFPPLKVG